MTVLSSVFTLLCSGPVPSPSPRPASPSPETLRLLIDYCQRQSFVGGTVEDGPDVDALSAHNLALAACHRAIRRAADRA